MSPASVIERLDVVEDLGLQFLLLRPGAAMDQLLLERCKEALGQRVVVGRSDLAHRLGDAVLLCHLAEGQTDVLGGFN